MLYTYVVLYLTVMLPLTYIVFKAVQLYRMSRIWPNRPDHDKIEDLEHWYEDLED